MRIKELVHCWKSTEDDVGSIHKLTIEIPSTYFAKILALAEMFPTQNIETITVDLITAALHELELSFPYIEGHTIIGEDELGDPMYEDIGPTPRYLQLSKEHFSRVKN